MAPPSVARPNIIVFFTDQQRWDTMGLHGNPMDLTSNLDRLARRGTHLANCFTCQPVCGPARSCMQTGRYATHTGCYHNGLPLPDDASTLAHSFRAAGYSTGYIGKWHLGGKGCGVGAVPDSQRGGYEYWLASNTLEFTSGPYQTTLYNNDNQAMELPGYRVDALADAAIRWIAAPRQNPFFLFLSFIEPHHQNQIDDYPPPEGYRSRYAGGWIPPDLAALGGTTHQHLAGYYGMVKRLDEALGRLCDALKSLGLEDSTVVLFTSDHGSHFKTRNAEYKRSCHESSLRVPGAIWGPGFDGGGEVGQLVSLIDVPPTLLDAAGLPVPPVMQGRSLRGLLHGEGAAEWPGEVFAQISEAEVGRCVRTHKWKYAVDAPHKDPWKDSGSDRYLEKYLYDLESDPYELCNLIEFESHREVASILRERLIRRMVEAGEDAPEIVPARTRAVPQRRVAPEDTRR